jgi:hypothetical protein
MLLYVQKNEETSCVKMVYFNNDAEGGIPSELEANAKSMRFSSCFISYLTHVLILVLDEAFPEITVDLVRCFTLS